MQYGRPMQGFGGPRRKVESILPGICCLLACATAPAAPPKPADAPKPPSIEQAPTPFTALEIRKATAVGRTYEYHVEEPDKPEAWVILKFTRVVDNDADVARMIVDARGTPLQPPETSLVTWEELRRHAEFPVSAVQIADEQMTVPIGTFDCLRYTVAMPDAEGHMLRFYFAKTLPGAPIFWYEEKSGKRIKTSTLIRYVPGG
jgi:hypothetical protein